MSAKIPPKPGKDVIYIDVDDEITSIIDKVENAKEKVVALVLPKRAASLQSIVNMKLLKRSADQADKNPVLITSEAALLPLAGAAGLHVAKNLQSSPEIPSAPAGLAAAASGGATAAAKDAELPAEELPETADEDDLPQKIDYGSATVGALAAAHAADDGEAIDLDDEDEAGEAAEQPKPKAAKAPKDKKNKVPDFDRFKMMLVLGAVGLAALITFMILAIFVLPKATITLTTASEPVSANFTITASTSIKTLDAQKGQIPATQQTTDQTGSQSVTATGQQNNGQKATGSVTISNCSSNPVTIPAGTGISQNGLAYITSTSLSLDSGNFDIHGNCKASGSHVGSTGITAVQAGSKYNATLSGAVVQSGVTASGSASGGTDSIVTVVSQADVDGAKQKIASANSADDFVKSWKQKLQSQGLYVIDSTLKAADPLVSSNPAVGQPASNATITVKVSYTVLTVQKADLTATVQAQMAGQYDKSKQKLSNNYLNDATFNLQSQSSPTSATLAVSVNTTAVPIIDPASVKKVAAGKKAGDIQSAIGGWAGVKNVKVDLSPFWVSKAPTNTTKIKVVLIEAKSSSNTSAP